MALIRSSPAPVTFIGLAKGAGSFLVPLAAFLAAFTVAAASLAVLAVDAFRAFCAIFALFCYGVGRVLAVDFFADFTI
jgi:hypothetical protein